MEGGYKTIMVDYPNLSSLNNESGIAGLMALPNSSYPYFWVWILAGIWVIITLNIYFKDKDSIGRTRLLAAMAISSFAIVFLAVIGSVFIISQEMMIYILVLCLAIIALWFFLGGKR